MKETIKENDSNSLNVVALITAYFGKVYFTFSVQTSITTTIMGLYPCFSLTACVCQGKGAATIQLSGCTDMVILITCMLLFLGNHPRNTATVNLQSTLHQKYRNVLQRLPDVMHEWLQVCEVFLLTFREPVSISPVEDT